MNHLNTQIQKGFPGLIMIGFGQIFSWISTLNRGDVTFILGTTATGLAILYYVFLIIPIIIKYFKKDK